MTSSPSPEGSPVGLLVVGTPRSGTTLVQRLASEATGWPTLPETHVFTVFAPRLLRRTSFPLAGDELTDALTAYAGLRQHGGGAPDPQALSDRLGGRAESLVELFEAVVALQSGEAPRVVEKTPDHLLWAHHLAPALPTTGFVAVVRDPRAVFASTRAVHWGQRNPVRSAERWSRDQRLVRRLADRLPPDRLLVLRYEDVVADEAATRDALRTFALADEPDRPRPDRTEADDDGSGASIGSGRPTAVFRPHEQGWKGRVDGAVTTERVEAWRLDLDADTVSAIEAVAGSEMARWRYAPVDPESARGPEPDPRAAVASPSSSLSSSPSSSLSSDARSALRERLDVARRRDQWLYRARRVAHELRIDRQYAPRAGLVGTARRDRP